MENSIPEMFVCPDCGGDGKETCHNPDHGFINALSFHDVGRLGCPVCGHDNNYKVHFWKDGKKQQRNCETCNGKGIINQEQVDAFNDEYPEYDQELQPAPNTLNNHQYH